MSRQSDYISEVRVLNKQLWDAINGLVSKQREFNALDYGTALADGGEADAAKRASSNNATITKAEIGSVVFDTTNALVDLLNKGHATNMAKLL